MNPVLAEVVRNLRDAVGSDSIMHSILQSKTCHFTQTEDEVIWQLREGIASGKHWYIALLEAIGQWSTSEEVVDGRNYKYLIDGEAFDWLLLVERLCWAVGSMLPINEKETLLFHGKPPLHLTSGEFKKIVGDMKYRQSLNYFYGITAEEALLQAVEDEVRKERRTYGDNNQQKITDEANRRVYGIIQKELFKLFQREKNYHRNCSINLTQLKEFTYWLFKYRLKRSEKARIGSDTEKALKWLKNNGFYSVCGNQ
ncbi:MAG: hypothetical protein JSV74_03700 [Dehalococcoidia bacterium]|nr:MAG: hypothetical protein JSV74_03700 [Dehalococcoidia bacterium]